MTPQLFHGSDDPDLTELEGNEPGYVGSLGFGLYLTTDPDFARVFGKHLYAVVSPVPEDKVANIEPNLHECGNSLTLYTPGSSPFTFDIEDLHDASTHRYSVLGDCEEQVKAALFASALARYKVSDELKQVAGQLVQITRSTVAKVLSKANDVVTGMGADERMDDLVGRALDDLADSTPDLPQAAFDQVEEFLERVATEADEFATAKTEEWLGEEIDLDELSTTCERHGYSAFFISDYAPGDEYVIFDGEYLPIPVKHADDHDEG